MPFRSYVATFILGLAVLTPPGAHGRETASSGIDIQGMDTTVPPGDDFYAYANGGWLRRHPPSAAQAWTGIWPSMQEHARAQSRALLEAARHRPGSRMGDLYASFLDTTTRDRLDLSPMHTWLARIDAVADRKALARVTGELAIVDVGVLFGLRVGEDDGRPGWAVVTIRQGGLGLPDAAAYAGGTPEALRQRTAYTRFLQTMLQFTGVAPDQATARVRAVLAFERELAATHWSPTRTRDAEATYHQVMPSDLDRIAPGFDWHTYLQTMGLADQRQLVLAEPDATRKAAALCRTTPLPILRDYLRLHLLANFSRYLGAAQQSARFAFHDATLKGLTQPPPPWQKGVALVTNMLPGELGKAYVARYFPATAAARMGGLVGELRQAFDRRLANAAWLSPKAREEARAKLAKTRIRIGYPDTWPDESGIVIRRDDLVGNVERIARWRFGRMVASLRHPIDHGAWTAPVTVANAYASAGANELIFPAATLQPPLFDPSVDAAANYARIGATIGHELSHLFDDQGRKYDAEGRLHDDWSATDAAHFDARAHALVAQYDQYESLPGEHVQGALVQGEAIADLAGLEIALAAYCHVMDGDTHSIDGFSAMQRFFIAWAQMWRATYRSDYLRTLLRTDAHPPASTRALTVRNLDAWYDAFDVGAGSRLYLAPAQRVEFW